MASEVAKTETIDAVYKVFAKYGKPRDFPACEHCMSKAEKRALLKPCLRELNADELTKYAADALFTVGSVLDFKYFLPRILELSVNDNGWWPGPEMVLAKLRLAEWDNWPENEKVVLVALLNEKFATLIKDSNVDGGDIDKWICGLGRCMDDITPYLDSLLEQASENTLLSFIESNHTALTKGKLSNAFWDSPANEQRLWGWFNSNVVKGLLTAKYGMIS